MDSTERRIIDELFGKLQEAGSRSGPRDVEAETLIRRHLQEQPAAPYYMAQAIIVQEQALAALQTRIEEMERELAERPAGGGFLGGLFGGNRPAPAPVARGSGSLPASGSPGRHAFGHDQGAMGPSGYRQGGGFLAGAMQTAMGVAGGMLVANAISSAFGPAAAQAAELAPDDTAPEPDAGEEDSFFAQDDSDFGDMEL